MSVSTAAKGNYLFAAVECRLPDCAAKMVLIALADYANENGLCWPSHARIAEKASVSRRTAIRKLAELEAAGLILTKHRSVDGVQISNVYQLNLSAIHAMNGNRSAPFTESIEGDQGDAGGDTVSLGMDSGVVSEVQAGSVPVTPKPPIEPPNRSVVIHSVVDGELSQSHCKMQKRETAKADHAPAPPASPDDDLAGDTVIALPTNQYATKGETFLITTGQLAMFETVYPAVNVPEHLARMRAWLIANPANRKTRRGMLRFVNAWLTKEQDRGRRGTGPPSTPPSTSTRARSIEHDLTDTDWAT